MKIALVQFSPESTHQKRMEQHFECVHIASLYQSDIIIFPEMSLTGYMRKDGEKHSFIPKDVRLETLRLLAHENNINIIAGAPIQFNSKLFIASYIFSQGGKEKIYCKQFLHKGEELYFSHGEKQEKVSLIREKAVSFAICSDISQPEHCQDSVEQGANMYLASIFFTAKGIRDALSSMGTYAKSHRIFSGYANYCGCVWGIEAGGQSSFWNPDGKLIGQLDSSSPGILIIDLTGEIEFSKILPLYL